MSATSSTVTATLRIRPLTEHIGAEIEGLDLSRPISAEQFHTVNAALVAHGVLVFRNQHLPPAMHVDFPRASALLSDIL